MTNKEFKAFLDMLICNDPWCVHENKENQKIIENFADKEAKKRGFDSWNDAYKNIKNNG